MNKNKNIDKDKDNKNHIDNIYNINKNLSTKKDLIFINNIIMLIIKKINEKVFNMIDHICNANPTFSLKWILSFFGSSFDNIFFHYRILDYIICSHPLAVFYLSANLIVYYLTRISLSLLFPLEDSENKDVNIENKIRNKNS